MKILYVQHARVQGGSHVSFKEMLKLSILQGNECHVIGMNKLFLNEYKSLGAHVHYSFISIFENYKGSQSSFKKTLKFLFSYFLSICFISHWILRIKPNLVHLNSLTLCHYILPIKLLRMKVVIHIREHVSLSFHGMIKDMTFFFIKYADQVISISESELEYFDYLKKSIVIYNFTSLMPSKNHSKDNEDVGKYTFLVMSGIAEIKSSYLIAEAFIKLNSIYPNIRLIMLGGGADYLDPTTVYQKKFKILIDKSNNQNIELTKFINDPADIIDQSNALIFWTSEPHFPRPVYEAWLFQKLVIVSNSMNNIADITVRNSLVAKGDTVDDLIGVMEMCFSHKNFNELISCGHKIACEKFGPNNFLKIQKIYEDLILKR